VRFISVEDEEYNRFAVVDTSEPAMVVASCPSLVWSERIAKQLNAWERTMPPRFVPETPTILDECAPWSKLLDP
jgi:hypothetical protein